MNDIEVLIALVAAAIVLVRLADAISIPYPIVLVLGGLGIGFIPGGPTLELQPDVVFLVFLPPLLQSAGYWASPKELRAELVPLTWLVIGLSLATMVAVAAVAQAVIPSISWAEGFVLGAIVAPTDPVAAIATFQSETALDRLRELYQARFARCVAALQGEDSELPIEDPLTGYRRLREDLIQTERDTLLGMRNDGRIKQDLFRRIQRDIDLDEARLGT